MNNTQLVPVGDMQTMAGALAKSGLFGVKTADQALALMIVAQAEGRHPGSVASDYHIIQGRASLKSDAMLARFQQAGGKVEWHDHSNDKVAATFSHPQGGSLRIDWDMPRAKAAGLGSKDNWRQYPRQMLRARVISEGVRAVYPAVLNGMYTPEEVQEFDAPRPARAAKVEPKAEVIEVIAPNMTVEKVEGETVIALRETEQSILSGAEVYGRNRLEDFEAAFAGREAEVEAFLRHRKQLAEGESWREAAEYLEERVAGKLPAFLQAVEAFHKEAKA